MNKKPMTTMMKSKPRLVPLPLALYFLLGLLASCMPGNNEGTDNLTSLTGRGYGIHTASILVQDLDSTLKYYTDVLGFTVPPFSRFENMTIEGTKTASFPFPNMSILELVAINDTITQTDQTKFIRDFLTDHEGARMYALSSSSVDSTQAWLLAQDFLPDSIQTYSKAGDQSEESGWDQSESVALTVGFENMNPPAHLPTFLELTGFPYNRMHEFSSFYYMQRGFMTHANGAVGIIALKIVVDDLQAARKEYEQMGFPAIKEKNSDHVVRIQLKRDQELHLVSPQSPDDELAAFLKRRGSGVFAIRFEVKDLGATYDFLKEKLPGEALRMDSLPEVDSLAARLTVLPAYTHGVQLEFDQEPEEQGLMAQQLNLGMRSKLDSVARKNAEGIYLKYCALCHGNDREGYAADFAPSLKSHSLLATSQGTNFLRYTIQYGRNNTAMAGYYESRGGPLSFLEIELLLKWLKEESGIEEPVKLSREPVAGDVELGANIYAQHCAVCHGEDGEGISAPALGNPMLLATATDEFLKYAIQEGRDGTPMVAFKDSLNEEEINGVTAFLRSRASGWDVPEGDSITVPSPEEYVLNPNSKSPTFKLRDGLYVSAEQVNKALQDSMRLVILDARSTVAWRQMHIPGAIPVPYYEEPEDFVEDMPNDSTWIVVYCACPHAASGKVVSKLRSYGFKNTAIIDEGILVWAQMGYPVSHGQ